jgi:hypothetical protein
MVNNIFGFIFNNRHNSFRGLLSSYGLSTAKTTIPADRLLSQLHIAQSYLVRGALVFMNIVDEASSILLAQECPV